MIAIVERPALVAVSLTGWDTEFESLLFVEYTYPRGPCVQVPSQDLANFI
jgi:hypothetical protein